MDLFRASTRPLAGLKASLRHCQAQKRYRHERIRSNPIHRDGWDANLGSNMPPKQGFWLKLPPPAPEPVHKKIKILPSPPSEVAACPKPLIHLNSQQLVELDPRGQRQRMFARTNPERAGAGDILLVKQKNGDPFVGVCISVRRSDYASQGGFGADTSILLRNTMTNVGVERTFKIFSPNVQSIEVVKRAEKRPRRARLTYLRNKKHDPGSLAGVLDRYTTARARITGSNRGRVQQPQNRNKNKRR